MLPIVGGTKTVNVTPLLAKFCALVTTTFPLVAPDGTDVVMVVSVQVVADALTPPKLIVPVLCVVPNPEPLIVTEVPTTPEEGLKLLITGAGANVNVPAFRVTPLAVVTTTGPVCTGLGVVTPICVSFHEVTVPATPLKVTVPAVVPKPIP